MVNELNRHGKIIFGFEVPIKITQQHREIACIKDNFSTDDSSFVIKVEFGFREVKFDYCKHNLYVLTVFLELLDIVNKKSIVCMTIEERQYDTNYSAISVTSSCYPNILFDGNDNISFSYFLPIWEKEIQHDRKSYYDDHLFEIANRKYQTFVVYREIFQSAIETIQQELLDNLIHLGSLRDRPYHEYRINRELSQVGHIGEFGENAIGILYQNQDKLCKFVELPLNNEQVISWSDLTIIEITLIEAVNKSLNWLGMPALKIIEIVPGMLIKVIIPTSKSEKKWVTIADIGLSVSQIVPFLVMGLLSEPNSILVFEHPEIHLHSRNQAKLAELLACFAHIGKRVIVETCSDHLINRLCRLVAEDTTNQFCDMVKY
jgi:hypothetical protein